MFYLTRLHVASVGTFGLCVITLMSLAGAIFTGHAVYDLWDDRFAGWFVLTYLSFMSFGCTVIGVLCFLAALLKFRMPKPAVD